MWQGFFGHNISRAFRKYHLKLKRRSLFTEIQNTFKSPIVKNSHVTKYYKISYRYNKLKRRS